MSAVLAFAIVVGVLCLTAWAIVADSERRAARAHAQAIHPANYVTVSDGAIVPLICPVCQSVFANAYLAESGRTIGGWVELRAHECVVAA